METKTTISSWGQVTGTIGHGQSVHLLYNDNTKRTLCGSGNNTKGTRKTFTGRQTNQEVTCKHCLEILASQKAVDAVLAEVEAQS